MERKNPLYGAEPFTMVIDGHRFEVDPLTDPEVQLILREAEKAGGWEQWMKKISREAGR
jgi:hypothetical protein